MSCVIGAVAACTKCYSQRNIPRDVPRMGFIMISRAKSLIVDCSSWHL